MRLMQLPLAGLLVGAVGCATVQPIREPSQFIPQAKPNLVVVIYNDNSQVPVSEPRMSGDTLFGTWLGVGDPVAVPLSQVRRIDAVQRDKKRTTLMIAGVTLLAAGGVYALAIAGKSGHACDLTYKPPTVSERDYCYGPEPM